MKEFWVKGRKEEYVIKTLNRIIPKFIWKNKLERIAMKVLKVKYLRGNLTNRYFKQL